MIDGRGCLPKCFVVRQTIRRWCISEQEIHCHACFWVHGALLIEMEDNQIATYKGDGRLFSIIVFFYSSFLSAVAFQSRYIKIYGGETSWKEPSIL